MTTNNDDYELIEVPVSHKIEVNLTLDDLLSAVAQQAMRHVLHLDDTDTVTPGDRSPQAARPARA